MALSVQQEKNVAKLVNAGLEYLHFNQTNDLKSQKLTEVSLQRLKSMAGQINDTLVLKTASENLESIARKHYPDSHIDDLRLVQRHLYPRIVPVRIESANGQVPTLVIQL